MAIRFLDHFDSYSATQIYRKWTQAYGTDPQLTDPLIGSGAGRRSTNAVQFAATPVSNPKALSKVLTLSGATLYWAFSFRTDGGHGSLSTPTPFGPGGSGRVLDPALNPFTVSSTAWLCWLRYTDATHLAVHVRQNGQLAVYRGEGEKTLDAIPTLLGASTLALPVGATVHIDMKVLLHASAGTVSIRVNGEEWLGGGSGLSGLNTLGKISTGAFGGDAVDLDALADEIILGGLRTVAASPALNWYFDDFYIGDTASLMDGLGTVINDTADRLGDVRVSYTVPTIDGSNSDWTPSSGSDNYAMVDEVPADDDVTYNETATQHAKDTFPQAGAPITTATVLGMFVEHTVKAPDAGISQTTGLLRLDGTDYRGTGHGNASDYLTQQDIWMKRPTDGADFTVGNTQAAEIGYEKTE